MEDDLQEIEVENKNQEIEVENNNLKPENKSLKPNDSEPINSESKNFAAKNSQQIYPEQLQQTPVSSKPASSNSEKISLEQKKIKPEKLKPENLIPDSSKPTMQLNSNKPTKNDKSWKIEVSERHIDSAKKLIKAITKNREKYTNKKFEYEFTGDPHWHQKKNNITTIKEELFMTQNFEALRLSTPYFHNEFWYSGDIINTVSVEICEKSCCFFVENGIFSGKCHFFLKI